jgi:hypothetical protein
MQLSQFNETCIRGHTVHMEDSVKVHLGSQRMGGFN